MSYFFKWIIILISVLGAGFLLGKKEQSNCQTCSETPEQNHSHSSQPKNNEILPVYSKKAIEEKLIKLADTPVTEQLSRGAMCYKMAMPKNVSEYTCPTCGEKTIYKDWMGKRIEEELPSLRRIVASIKQLKLILDENGLCSHCRKEVLFPQNMNIGLKIIWPDKTENYTSDIQLSDMIILQEFLEGKTVFKGERDSINALKNYLPRLRKILGIQEKKEK